MINQPRFKQCFQVETVEPETVFLLSERGSIQLNRHLYQQLVPLIDGHHTVEDIIDQVLQDLPTETISFQEMLNTSVMARHALMQMEQKGYIVESESLLPDHLASFCEMLNVEVQQAYQRLQRTKVAVSCFGSLASSEFLSTLESLQIQVADQGEIDVVLTDDYLHVDLDAFNQNALQSQRPWMLVKPVGTMVWIGPIIQPGKTGCWHCLAQRLRDNRPIERFIQNQQNCSTPIPIPLTSFPASVQTAWGMAATELFKWIVQGENQRLTGVLVTHDTLSLDTRNHRLVKRPQCPSCGLNQQLNRNPLPIILGHRKKRFTTDGGHRYCSPEETLKSYHHHLSPITGVVRELTRLETGVNHLTHTYLAKHHFATLFDDLNTLRQNLGGRSAGKGRTDAQAKASGFCEAIERYSGVFQGDEIRETGSYQTLGDRVIHPNRCMNFSSSQYETRQEWNSKCAGWFQKVPEPFDEEREREWTPVWSLTEQGFKYLPTAYCYYGYPQVETADCWADSNGCAAGNTLEEAILQGFMELVERDSVALWWYNRIQRPKVDLESFDDPYFYQLNEYYQSLHRELWVLDITSDLNIPVFAAISRRCDRAVEDIILGYGAHFDPKIAIQRALTEVNQILPSVLRANADGSTLYNPGADPMALDWWKMATVANQPYLVADETRAVKVQSDYPQVWSDDLKDDVIRCQQIVKNRGMELLVLDQTRPDIGLKVVKVIVPGMRHFWKRLGSGRLYQVPVELGWLKAPLPENQLNPFPMWM
ncbi:MAG: TOMM precursor leader peptide-binding protein [Coleofasciculus sp. B1-GNL1-01]|uniref:TOMM precursor leader peptide-binding protein n=1 Tax=Coleofasciculus sp. B1-GNL1-01 TaxID=3068484 RepID=UPI0032F103F5